MQLTLTNAATATKVALSHGRPVMIHGSTKADIEGLVSADSIIDYGTPAAFIAAFTAHIHQRQSLVVCMGQQAMVDAALANRFIHITVAKHDG